jgi:drug/metabolite transporter (DMT)-like permease
MINFMNNKPYIALFISVLSVSFAAIFIVTAYTEYEANYLSIAFFRLFFTFILITPMVLIYKKYRKELVRLPKKTYFIMIGIGIILALHFTFWIASLASNNFTSVASSVILVTAHPVLVAPIAHYFFKEKLSIINIAGICISLIGVVILVFGNKLVFSGLDSFEGNILAILGGICAGLYILGGRKIRKTVSVVSYAFVVYGISALVLFFFCLFSSAQIIGLDARAYGIIFLMAIVSGIFGHTFYNWSLKHIRASLASVALLGEPLGSTLLALVIPWIQQVPSYYTAVGGAIILTGIYLTSRKNRKGIL